MLSGPSRQDDSPLLLRPLIADDAAHLQPMFDDPVIRASLGCPEQQEIDAAAWVDAVLAQQQREVLRETSVFGIVPSGADVPVGVVMVKAGWKAGTFPQSLASIIHPQGAAVGGSGPVGAYACYARFLVLRGYAKHPAGGPGGRGFHVPRGLLPCLQGRFRAGQGACGRASIRCHAAVIASAQGQVAWIFRRRRRPPRTIRAAACSTRYLL